MEERACGESFSKQDSMCLKGIAILIMMFHHCYRSKDRFEAYVVDFRPFNLEFMVNISDYFKICVSIFVFITGYGLYLSARNRCQGPQATGRWVYERLVKTLSGFWFVYVLVFVITQIYAGYPAEIYFGQNRIRGVIYILIDFLGLANFFATPTMVSTWWYMSAAVAYIVLFPVFVKWTQTLGFTTLFAAIAFLPRYLGECGYPGGTSILTFLCPLIMGMAFARYDGFAKLDSLKAAENKTVDACIQFIAYHALLIGSIIVWIRFARDVVWEYHVGIAPLVFICYCKKYVVRMPLIKEFLILCGKHSMNIFLVHSFIRLVFFQDFIYSFRYFWLIVLVLFVISLGISILIEWLKKWMRFDRYVNIVCEKICS